MTNRSKHVCVANRKILEKDNIVSHNTQIHDGTLSCLGTGTSIKCVGNKLVLWAQTSNVSEMMRSSKCIQLIM